MTDVKEKPATPRKRARRRGGWMTWLGVLLLIGGVGTLGWVGYDMFFNPLVDPVVSQQKIDDLKKQWEQPEPKVATVTHKPVRGDAVALMRIPKFGETWVEPVLYGTDDSTLSKGLGWYEGTAGPGEVGNFAIAGHRGSKGPFAAMQNLVPGDKVIVETKQFVFTYVIDNVPKDTVVKNTDVWVVDPVPGKPNEKPTKALMTLTTCQDLFRSPDRMITFTHLESKQAK